MSIKQSEQAEDGSRERTMPTTRGSAAYKKQDGTLELSKVSGSIVWTPVAGPASKAVVSLPVSSITNLQQTPSSSAKVMLKVFVQPPGSKATDTHVFTFTSSAQARAEADGIRDALSRAIQISKSNGTPVVSGGGGGGPTSMAIAGAASSTSGGDPDAIYSDDKLVQDNELQRSLLSADRTLQKIFAESMRTRPETLSLGQFQSQFWSSRVHLLRAHAIEKRQTRGSYNVLATVKPITVDGQTKLSISKEQIQLLFSQHPVVNRAYDENVPKISEESFWSRFFQSRLSKKLKGERIVENDPADGILDKYLSFDEETERAKRMLSAHVPHIIDLEGNEENHSQRKGNDGDRTMRPTALNKAPIIRTLNSLSEKILSQVTPNDVDPSLPIGVDEATYNELRLRDLQGEAAQDRNILNIKDQSRFFASNEDSGLSEDGLRFAKQTPRSVVKNTRAEIAKAGASADLSSAIGVHDSDSSDDEVESARHVGSASARAAATSQMMAAIRQQRLYTDDPVFSTVNSVSTSGLSQTVFDRLVLNHATSTEYLNHFWSAFLSGSPSRAVEIGHLVETLDRCMDRIQAIGEDAETDRQDQIEKLNKRAQDFFERTGKKTRPEREKISGGRKAVNQLIEPTVQAIEKAGVEYRRALIEQSQNGV